MHIWEDIYIEYMYIESICINVYFWSFPPQPTFFFFFYYCTIFLPDLCFCPQRRINCVFSHRRKGFLDRLLQEQTKSQWKCIRYYKFCSSFFFFFPKEIHFNEPSTYSWKNRVGVPGFWLLHLYIFSWLLSAFFRRVPACPCQKNHHLRICWEKDSQCKILDD